jgi:hypothetical protein
MVSLTFLRNKQHFWHPKDIYEYLKMNILQDVFGFNTKTSTLYSRIIFPLLAAWPA